MAMIQNIFLPIDTSSQPPNPLQRGAARLLQPIGKALRWRLGVVCLCLLADASIGSATAQDPAPATPPAATGDTIPKQIVPAPVQPPGTASGLLKGWSPSLDLQPNTTIVPRSAPPLAKAPPKPKAKPPAKPKALPSLISSLNLVAFLTDTGQEIEQGIIWRIYKLSDARDDTPKLLRTVRRAKTSVQLLPGSYVVIAAYGRAHLTRKIAIHPVSETVERFVLNAGGLRIAALLSDGTKAPDSSVTFDVFSDERNQFGNRTQVITNARPGTIIRLNAGIYFIVSTYGDANAQVRSDVTVEAGKLSETSITHAAARITFKLVARPGGEALADTRWSLTTQKGLIVKQSEGAIPTHILAAGDYVINAQHNNRIYRSQFQVVAGQNRQIEVIMR